MKSLKQSSSQSVIRGTRLRNGFGIFALLGLFMCGLFVGLTWRGDKNVYVDDNELPMQFTVDQCKSYKERIQRAVYGDDAEILGKMQDVYAIYCVNPISEKGVEAAVENPQPVTDLQYCERVEKLLQNKLYDLDSADPDDHMRNSDLYKRLAYNGCPDNKNKFLDLASQEQDLARLLVGGEVNIEKEPCEIIEKNLINNIEECHHDDGCFFNNAKIYAQMFKHGCLDNRRRNAESANTQLTIAIALTGNMEFYQDMINEIHQLLDDGIVMNQENSKSEQFVTEPVPMPELE